jgi:hypothetical protein
LRGDGPERLTLELAVVDLDPPGVNLGGHVEPERFGGVARSPEGTGHEPAHGAEHGRQRGRIGATSGRER